MSEQELKILQIVIDLIKSNIERNKIALTLFDTSKTQNEIKIEIKVLTDLLIQLKEKFKQ